MACSDPDYEKAVAKMNEKGRYKLANWVAHGYQILATVDHTIIARNGEFLAIDNQGNQWKLTKVI